MSATGDGGKVPTMAGGEGFCGVKIVETGNCVCVGVILGGKNKVAAPTGDVFVFALERLRLTKYATTKKGSTA